MPTRESTASKMSFGIKDVIYIIGIVLSILGTYYTLKSDVEKNSVTCEANKKLLEQYQLPLMAYKIDQTLEIVTKLDAKIDRLIEEKDNR